MFGVDAQRKEHPAIRSGKKELRGNTEGSLGASDARVDGQRLYLGPGSGGMGGTRRVHNGGGPTATRVAPTSFRVRKRTLKG
jgi:hypothetical protein